MIDQVQTTKNLKMTLISSSLIQYESKIVYLSIAFSSIFHIFFHEKLKNEKIKKTFDSRTH